MLTEAFRIIPGTVQTASGQLDPFPCGNFTRLEIDVNVTSLRGTSLNFAYSRVDAFGNVFPVATGGLTKAGQVIFDIGAGLTTPVQPGQSGIFAWTLAGTMISTTVGTGANSATQNLTSTTGMLVGDSLHFVTANVTVTIVTVTDGTHIVVSAPVNSTSSEVVNAINTPAATFSALGEGK